VTPTEAGLRGRKKEKTRDALATTALRLFAARGFDHVTVEEIAAECDISARTFFRYFATKEEVLFADADQRLVGVVAAMRREPPSAPPIRALEAAVRTIVPEYERARNDIVLRHRIAKTTPSLQMTLSDRIHTWQASLADELRADGRGAALSDLDLRLTVAVALSALQVAMEVWLGSDRPPAPLDELLALAFRRVRRGLDPSD
jgi:AcrR family transcriptional regulator